jgi:MFS superfamily sulfate permease-like transporter
MRDFLANITARAGVLKGVLPLSRAAAARDALAGVQLASMDIPQVLGYARIAGMPAVTGLYTVFLPLVAFAFFGASRHLVVAADSATATIFASRLSTMAPAGSARRDGRAAHRGVAADRTDFQTGLSR